VAAELTMTRLARADLVLSCGLALLAAAGSALPAEPSAAIALAEYLATDCEVDDAGLALSRLLVHVEVVEPGLIAVLRDGPDVSPASTLRQEAEQAWERRSAFLATNPPLGLSPEHLLAVHGVEREAWIESRLAQIVHKERERAVAALARIASPSALRALRQTRRADPRLRGAIDAALGRIYADPLGPRTHPARAARPGRP
jgi:hypothetical protein